ncbi:hypothetical protein NL676_022962 [Syzygium grande]|nr:hypothetical protein NL676_022962 [Syzygium grande]
MSEKLQTSTNEMVRRSVRKTLENNSINLHGGHLNNSDMESVDSPLTMPSVGEGHMSLDTEPSPPSHLGGFRPTSPGHSPSIGHAVHNQGLLSSV